jgi:hypothetical protein
MADDATRGSCLRAFGLSITVAGPPPPGAWALRSRTEPTLRLERVTPQVIAERWSGRLAPGWAAMIDEAPFSVEQGRAGDHRFVHGKRAVHHLSEDARVLRCSPASADHPDWWRIVLDSVLFSVALISGFEALHAGAVATPAGAVAISAGPGGGKSTLVAELVRRGVQLFSDDVVVLEATPSGTPLAHPGPPLMTVPTRHSEALGTVISSRDDERWVAVPVHAEPAALAALVRLQRAPGASTSMRRVAAPFAPLIDSLLRFPRSLERERARFEMASQIASRTPIWRLTADPAVDPETLADVLMTGLAQRGHRT